MTRTLPDAGDRNGFFLFVSCFLFICLLLLNNTCVRDREWLERGLEVFLKCERAILKALGRPVRNAEAGPLVSTSGCGAVHHKLLLAPALSS